ncbi:MAG: vitamin B12 dependent-methionine synthase activation domain-containing protein [Candidatus Edwardsbacteria bacterium]
MVTELGIPPVVWQTIEEEIQEAKTLVEPKVVYTDLLIKKIDKKKILFSGCPSESADLLIKSNSLARLLQRGTKATLFLLTIGQELEKRTENLFILGEKTKGLILDAIGSVAADDLAAQLHRLIFLRAKDEGYRVTGRFSPGYGDLSLILQKEILKILKAEKIGVSLTESFMLVPRKSVSGFIGWRKIISCS